MYYRFMMLFLLMFQFSFSQLEQAWVYFTPKENVAQQLALPTSFLTSEAIVRKNKFGVIINAQDLPINSNYISILKNQSGIKVHTVSKWFNAAYVSGDQSAIEALKNLTFVTDIFYLNGNLNKSAKIISSNTVSEKRITKFKTETITRLESATTYEQLNQINLKPLHSKNYMGQNVTIAVMDSGFPNVNTIPAFERAINNNQILGGFDFVNNNGNIFNSAGNSHGTNTLSTMLGYLENEFIGTAIDANYYLFITEDVLGESPLEEAYWIAAVEKADSLGVDIVTTSLGYTEFNEAKYNYNVGDMDGNTTFISQASNIAVEKGMLLVTSAGNLGGQPWQIISAPADAESVLSIGAVNNENNKAPFSSVGPTADSRIKPDIVALGVLATVIMKDGSIGQSNGTSFSGPIIAGAMASLMQALPNTSPKQLIDLVKSSSSLALTPNNEVGYGIPDFEKAFNNSVDLNVDIPITNDSETAITEIAYRIINNQLSITFPKTNSFVSYFIYNVVGSLVVSGKFFQNEAISIAHLNAGMYFLRVEGENVNNFKFIK